MLKPRYIWDLTMSYMEIYPEPMSKRARTLVILIIFGLATMWLLATYAYFTLPERIPVHFEFSGKPTSYGNKSTFLILPAAFSISQVIILLMTKYRFTLINKYPYLINLPAFFTYLPKIPAERRAIWINRYFEATLALGVFLNLFFLLLEYGIFVGEVSGRLPAWFMPLSISMPILLMLSFLIYMRKINRELQMEAK